MKKYRYDREPKTKPGLVSKHRIWFLCSTVVQHVEYHDDNDGTNADTDHPVLVVLVVVVIFLILMVLFGTRFLLGFTRFLAFPNISLIDDMVYCL